MRFMAFCQNGKGNMNTEENVVPEAELAAPVSIDVPTEAKPKKKRGRPTNAERAARTSAKTAGSADVEKAVDGT